MRKVFIAVVTCVFAGMLAGCANTVSQAETATSIVESELLESPDPTPEPIALTTENILEFLDFSISIQDYVETTERRFGADYTHARADIIAESRRLRNVTLENVTVTIGVMTRGLWTDATIEMNISFDGIGVGRYQIRHGGPSGTDSFTVVNPSQPSVSGLEIKIMSVTGYVVEN